MLPLIVLQVASDGLSVIGAEIDSSNNNAASYQLSSGYGHDVNVPVYATVKGVSALSALWHVRLWVSFGLALFV